MMYIPYTMTHRELIRIRVKELSVINTNMTKSIIDIDVQKNMLPKVDSSFLEISQNSVRAQLVAKVIKTIIITRLGLEITHIKETV